MTQMNGTKISRIIYPELSYIITGLCFEIQNEFGRFCREHQYCDVLENKLKQKGITYEREKLISGGIGGNKIDFIIDDKIILEAKSIPYITKKDYFQIQRYFEATQLKLALIINFRSKYLKPKRIVSNLI